MTTQFRLRPGVHVAPVAEGLSIVGRGQAFVVPGSVELGATWDKIFPALYRGGQRTELLAGLDPLHGELLLRVLDESGLLLGPGQGDGPGAADIKHFGRTLGYLESCAEHPYDSFRRLRDFTVEVPGDSTGTLAAARALLGFGVGRLLLDDSAICKRLEGLAEEVGAELLGPSDPLQDIPPDLRIAVDPLRPQRDDVPCVDVLLAGDIALIGPATTPLFGPTLTDLLERFRARTGRGLRAEATSPVAAALAGNLAAMQALSWRAGLDAGSGSHAYLVHTTDLRVEGYRFSRPARAAVPLRPPAEADPALLLPVGTIAPAPAMYPPPADKWLLALTDPASGLLDRPVTRSFDAVPVVVATCLASDQLPVYGYGPDEVAAARATVANAARSLVPRHLAQLWDRAGNVCDPGVQQVAAAGYSVPQMLREATRRLLHQCWQTDPGFGQHFVEVESGHITEQSPSAASAGPVLRIFQLGDRRLWVVTVLVQERLVALSCGAELEQARLSAMRHAAVAGVIDSEAHPDPVAAVMADENWDPWAALELLAKDSRILTGRWHCDAVLDEELILGWVAIQPIGNGS